MCHAEPAWVSGPSATAVEQRRAGGFAGCAHLQAAICSRTMLAMRASLRHMHVICPHLGVFVIVESTRACSTTRVGCTDGGLRAQG